MNCLWAGPIWWCQRVSPALSATSWKTTGPTSTNPPAVIGRFSESSMAACVPPVETEDCGWGAEVSAGCCADAAGSATRPTRATHRSVWRFGRRTEASDLPRSRVVSRTEERRTPTNSSALIVWGSTTSLLRKTLLDHKPFISRLDLWPVVRPRQGVHKQIGRAVGQVNSMKDDHVAVLRIQIGRLAPGSTECGSISRQQLRAPALHHGRAIHVGERTVRAAGPTDHDAVGFCVGIRVAAEIEGGEQVVVVSLVYQRRSFNGVELHSGPGGQ